MNNQESELLKRWLEENAKNPTELARMIGAYPTSVFRWLEGARISDKFRLELIKLGLKIKPPFTKEGHEGEMLRSYIYQHDIKLGELAKAFGVVPQQISNYYKFDKLPWSFKNKLNEYGVKIFEPQLSVVHEPNAVYVSDETKMKRSRVVHAQAYGSYLAGFQDEQYINGLPENYIYVDEPGVYRTFEVKGDSMEPDFPPGCLVDAKLLDPVHWKSLNRGKVFVFLHEERGVLIKLLLKQEGQTCTWRSINPMFDDFQTDMKDIREMWYFVQKHDTNRDYSRYLVR